MLGILYVIGTPIGNLKDITFRAVEILKEIDIILAEDTRVSGKLLSHYEIDKPIMSYHQHSVDQKKFEILELLLTGKNIGLVTDAGTPGISDPGNELIDFLCSYEPNIKVIPIPGVSALSSALSVSGFNVNNFVFLGFLPKKKRLKLMSWLKTGSISFAFYESPYRILKTLDFLGEQFGPQKRIMLAREMTKVFETLYRGAISEVKEKLENPPAGGKIKGEIVVVVEG